jgi:integrase
LAKNPGVYSDGGGLTLKVRSRTSASWTYRFMLNRVAREMGLGKYPDVSLAQARQLVAEARLLKALGKNPIIERSQSQLTTFRACAEQYIADRREGWKNQKHAQQWATTLEQYAYPKIGDQSVSLIDTALVVGVLKPIWLTKPETARRVRSRIELILDWARAHGRRVGENPARRGHLDNLLPSQTRSVKHHAALPLAELRAFMADLRDQEGIAARALEFAILTAARTGEIIGARWSEVDLDHKVWTIPAARMKAGSEHRVPLSRAAVDILAPVASASPESETFVFAGRDRKSLSNMALLAVLRRMGRSDITTHGFRSVFRDWAAEAGVSREVAEAALAHVVDNKVEAAYLRTTLFERRRKVMEEWATACL